MTTKAHKLLTGTDLHEPKGVESATVGQVYVSDGLGSGSWQTINTTVSFTTGDLKPTHKAVADTGWIIWQEGAIGSAASGATIRANADTLPLYRLYWAMSTAVVSGGAKGISADVDFNANRSVRLPIGPGRALVMAGAGTGLTFRTNGDTAGAEVASVTLVAANIPTITSVNASQPISVDSATTQAGAGAKFMQDTAGPISNNGVGGSTRQMSANAVASNVLSVGNNSISVTYTNASPTAVSHSTVQPSTFINIMIKL